MCRNRPDDDDTEHWKHESVDGWHRLRTAAAANDCCDRSVYRAVDSAGGRISEELQIQSIIHRRLGTFQM